MVLIFLRSHPRHHHRRRRAAAVDRSPTFGVMWFCGFSLDNLSLMALTIGTGFVVDDAIVMIENIVRHIEEGETPLEAALKGAREIGFTVISLTVSLIAVFIPVAVHDRSRRPHVPRVRADADALPWWPPPWCR